MTETSTDGWDLASQEQRLQAVEPGLRLEVVARIGSTNSALLERAASQRAGADGGFCGRANPSWQTCLLLAHEQTHGRGRQGRAWHACPGASLTFSLALTMAPREWSGLSLAVGLALAEALEPSQASRIGLKWPNDLWLRDSGAAGGGRKLGGVLIETSAWVGPRQGQGAAPRICVIGVGLNVGPQAVTDTSCGVACLRELDPLCTASQALARVAPPLLAAVRRFEQVGFAESARAFARRDLLLGQEVCTSLAELPVGMALGVDDSGALRVRAPNGRVHQVVGGEVTVRPLERLTT